MFSEKLWMFVFHGFGICMCSNLFSSSKPKLVFKSFKDFILPFSFKADQRTLIISQLFGLVKGFDISIDVIFHTKVLGKQWQGGYASSKVLYSPLFCWTSSVPSIIPWKVWKKTKSPVPACLLCIMLVTKIVVAAIRN